MEGSIVSEEKDTTVLVTDSVVATFCTDIDRSLDRMNNVERWTITGGDGIDEHQQIFDTSMLQDIESVPVQPSTEDAATRKSLNELVSIPNNNLNEVFICATMEESPNLEPVIGKTETNLSLNLGSTLNSLVDYSDTDTDETSATSEFSGSDEDSDVECDIIPTDPIAFRNDRFRDVEISQTSSDSETSGSTSSVWDSDDDSDVAIVETTEQVCQKEKEKECVPRTKGELRLCDLPPIEDLHITVPSQECIELGFVSSVVEELVVIQALPGLPALDLDTILFLKEGEETLGKVFDVFGPINEPCYSVRFNKNEDIMNRGILKGTKVYCAPRTEHTSYVMVSDLLKSKGSDASWREDNEPPLGCIEYSDDEEERRAKNKKQNKNTLPSVQERQPGKSKFLSDFEKRMNRRNLQMTAQYTDSSAPGGSTDYEPQFSPWPPSRNIRRCPEDQQTLNCNTSNNPGMFDPTGGRNRPPRPFHPYVEYRTACPNFHAYDSRFLRAPVFRHIMYQNMNIPPPPLPFVYPQTVLPPVQRYPGPVSEFCLQRPDLSFPPPPPPPM